MAGSWGSPCVRRRAVRLSCTGMTPSLSLPNDREGDSEQWTTQVRKGYHVTFEEVNLLVGLRPSVHTLA